MDAIISNALSGLNAASLRLEVSAANVANADSVGPAPDANPDANALQPYAPQPYAPLGVVQQPLLSGGTVAAVAPLDPRLVRRFAPDSPAANETGIVASPIVDLASEGIDQITAAESYRANLRVLQVAQALAEETVAILGTKRHDLTV